MHMLDLVQVKICHVGRNHVGYQDILLSLVLEGRGLGATGITNLTP